MIVALLEYRYSPDADEKMRALVPEVEEYSRKFDGCESFNFSFPVSHPGLLLGAEIWSDAASLNAHVAAGRDAPELESWHHLLQRMDVTLVSGERLTLEDLRAQGVDR